MANPTTNFGWVMPTATDLVTDLPADFAVFGQGVDTSMAYLLGGTTGQILSKTSGTNMAFTWINNDQGDLTAITAGTGISVTSGTGPIPSVAIDTAVTADLTTAQTLTNKKLSDSTTSIVDVTDATKAVKFDVGGTTAITGTIATNFTTAKTITIPDATDTLVGKATTDTLTNKTLTSPALTTPTISTATTNGDLLYGTGSGALTRLGIGSSAQVLTVASGVPSWATPAGGGGMVLISRASFSNVATTGSTFEGMFTTSYFNYQIVIHKITAGTAGDDLLFNFKYGTTTFTSNSSYYDSIATYNATAANIGSVAGTSSILARDCGSGNNPVMGNIYPTKVGQTTEAAGFTSLMNNTYGGEMTVGAGSIDSSSFTITGFVLKSSSSNITGTVSVYAYPN